MAGKKGIIGHTADLKKHLVGFFGINEAFVLFLIAVALFIYTLIVAPVIIGKALMIVALLSPVWLPFIIFLLWWEKRLSYIRAKGIDKHEMILLEIKVPRDIAKSPQAMELVLTGMYIGSGESTFLKKYRFGATRPFFSFEIASIEGRIGFYIWTRKSLKHLLESQIYAQYPEVEVVEVDDYTKGVEYVEGVNEIWGNDFTLSKDDALPIKTYIDFGLDKDPKEEYKIDPLAHLLEYMGSLGPGEQMWFQFIVRTDKDKVRKDGSLFEWEDRWKKEASEMVKKIRDSSTPKYKDATGTEMSGFPNPTPSQKEQIEAIERSMAKYSFNVGMRAIYVARKDAFRGTHVTGVLGAFRHFDSLNLNKIGACNWLAELDYPWQDYKDMRAKWMKKKVLELYRTRTYFYPEFSWTQFFLHPPIHKPYKNMTVEELATLYHIPSRVIQTPGITRIPAKKAEAPPNLPI